MNFKVYGPFKLNTESDTRWIDQAEIKKFWVEVAKHENLGKACGVYLFCVEGKQKG